MAPPNSLELREPISIEDRLRALEDKEAVLTALRIIARATDRCDAALLGVHIHPNARLDMGGRAPLGRTEFLEVMTAARGNVLGRMHIVTNQTLEIEGDVARAESYFISCQALERDGTPSTRFRAGRYLDILERQNAGWQLLSRTIVDEWSRIDPVRETANVGTLGEVWPNDLSYQLFGQSASLE